MLSNKTVLITGSSLGIGAEAAVLFAAEKCKVVITYYKDKKPAQDVAEKCKQAGAADVLVLQLNVMDNASIKKCVAAVVKKFKKIDILVNNAGVIAWKPLKEQTIQEIELQIRTNLEGLIKVTHACLPYITDCVINIASRAGKTGYASLAPYCGTKFGVRGFTQALAQEVAFDVFSVNPGLTKTRMTDFKGVSAIKVAEVILKTAQRKYSLSSGDDVDVWKKVLF